MAKQAKIIGMFGVAGGSTSSSTTCVKCGVKLFDKIHPKNTDNQKLWGITKFSWQVIRWKTTLFFLFLTLITLVLYCCYITYEVPNLHIYSDWLITKKWKYPEGWRWPTLYILWFSLVVKHGSTKSTKGLFCSLSFFSKLFFPYIYFCLVISF